MTPIYINSFRNDEDVCRLLATMRLEDGPPAVAIPESSVPHRLRATTSSDINRDNSPGIADSQEEENVLEQEGGSASSAARSHPTMHERPLASVADPRGKQTFFILRTLVLTSAAQQDGVYSVLSGKRTGLRDTWADAGDATQGVPGGQVTRIAVRPPRPRRGRRCAAYVVFEGLAPGIYNTWSEVKPLVNGVPGNIHQGFELRREAERAYVVAFALGALCILPPRQNTGQRAPAPAPATPTPEAVMTAFSMSSDDFLGAEWHVVFKGKRPGVYPAWNFAATQTKGIRNSVYNKFSSKAEAEGAYREALEEGYVEVL